MFFEMWIFHVILSYQRMVPVPCLNFWQVIKDVFTFVLHHKNCISFLLSLPTSTKLAEKDLEHYDEYNPFEHREVEKPNSTMGSLAHLLKSSLGTGILAMPAAFKNSGLLFGALGTIIVGLICTHCVHILVSTKNINKLWKHVTFNHVLCFWYTYWIRIFIKIPLNLCYVTTF